MYTHVKLNFYINMFGNSTVSSTCTCTKHSKHVDVLAKFNPLLVLDQNSENISRPNQAY